MTEKNVKVYSTPACPYCRRAKAYLDEKGVTYEDIDVSARPEAAEEMVSLSGQMSVPIIAVDDKVVVGFDRDKLDQLLG